MSDIVQPYDNNYERRGLNQSKVRVGGQLYYLIMDTESMTLKQVSGPQSSPYVYPYNIVSGISLVSNEYFEPCLEITISYETMETAGMTLVFETSEERDSAFSSLNQMVSNPAFVPPVTPEQKDYSDKTSQTGHFTENNLHNHNFEDQNIQKHGYDSYETEKPYVSGYNSGYESVDEYRSGDYPTGYENFENYTGYDRSQAGYDEYDRGRHQSYESEKKYDSYGGGFTKSFDEYKYSQSDLTIIEKITGFLRYPSETFESVSSEDLKSGILYAGLMLCLFSVVSVLFSAIIASAIAPESTIYTNLLSDIPELIRLILEYLIFGVFCVLIYGMLVFLLTKITGQELFFTESFITTLYSVTAIGTIGLIPLFGIFLAPLWMIFLQIKGLCSAYDIEVKFAAVSAVIPAVIMFAVFYYLIISGEVAFI